MINARFVVVNINFQNQFMYVKLMDDSIFEVPLKYLPVLSQSTEQERNNWELCGNGFAICWPELNNFILTASELIREFKEGVLVPGKKAQTKVKITKNNTTSLI